MTITAQMPKTEAAVKNNWAKVIFRPRGTWQNPPASCAMSRMMVLLREVRVNYMRNSNMPLMWRCDTVIGCCFFSLQGWQVYPWVCSSSVASQIHINQMSCCSAAVSPVTNKTADEKNPIMDQCSGLFVVSQEQSSETLYHTVTDLIPVTRLISPTAMQWQER